MTSFYRDCIGSFYLFWLKTSSTCKLNSLNASANEIARDILSICRRCPPLADAECDVAAVINNDLQFDTIE